MHCTQEKHAKDDYYSFTGALVHNNNKLVCITTWHTTSLSHNISLHNNLVCSKFDVKQLGAQQPGAQQAGVF